MPLRGRIRGRPFATGIKLMTSTGKFRYFRVQHHACGMQTNRGCFNISSAFFPRDTYPSFCIRFCKSLGKRTINKSVFASLIRLLASIAVIPLARDTNIYKRAAASEIVPFFLVFPLLVKLVCSFQQAPRTVLCALKRFICEKRSSFVLRQIVEPRRKLMADGTRAYRLENNVHCQAKLIHSTAAECRRACFICTSL